HHHVRPSTVKRFKSTYDPDLAACMERWIRIVIEEQRVAGRPCLTGVVFNTYRNHKPAFDITVNNTQFNSDYDDNDDNGSRLHTQPYTLFTVPGSDTYSGLRVAEILSIFFFRREHKKANTLESL
ncbi:hypothetical protein BGZ47_001837, partial [Haplosporangium gracile]